MSPQKISVLTLGLLVVFALRALSQDAPTPRQGTADTPKEPSAKEIQKLIDQLGSDIFVERQAASNRLEDIGEPAWNAVRKAAATSDDIEIRRRAERAANAIGRRCFGEVRRLLGHKGVVRDVAFSPDGRHAVSGAEDRMACLWEVASGKELRRFEGHTATIWGVAFSPDGRYVLTGSEDKTARLWDVQTGKQLKRFEGHKGRVRSVAFSRDGRRILCCGLESVRLLDLATGKELKTFEGFTTGPVHWSAFSPDERFLLTGDGNHGPSQGTVRLWEVASGKELRRMPGHQSAVGMVWFSPDGRLGVSSSHDKTVRLWEVGTGKELRRFQGHADIVEAVVFSPDGHRILSSGTRDRTVRLWDVDTGDELWSFEEQSSFVVAVAVSPDGRYALSGSGDGTLHLWRLPRPDKARDQAPPEVPSKKKN
jgi:WD40 repeat protein